jgi:hypothetical protein
MPNSQESFFAIVSAITPPLGMPKTIKFFLSSSFLTIFFSASPKMFAAVVLSLNLTRTYYVGYQITFCISSYVYDEVA